MRNAEKLRAQYSGDGLVVSFYTESVLDRKATVDQGSEVYVDKPYIWIRFPGDRTKAIRRPVRHKTSAIGEPPDSERFPEQWEAFQKGLANLQPGTPIEQWLGVDESRVLELKAANIFTVENVAAVPDSALGGLGLGGRALRDRAIAWLKSQGNDPALARVEAENAKLRGDMAALQARLAAIEAEKGKQ